MPLQIPDLDWIAATSDADESWLGPGPMLPRLQPWMEQLVAENHRQLVLVTWCAATAAVHHWQRWVAESPELATDSLCDSAPPNEQLAAVNNWITNPSQTTSDYASKTVDLTKQLHWFDGEYRETWFTYPGMWAIESSEFCVLSLTGDRDSQCDYATHGAISVACAINSSRRCQDSDVREPLSQILKLVTQHQSRVG